MKADNEVRTIWAENLLAWTEDRSEEVLKWLKCPAESGVPQAMKLMGDLCATGVGIKKNLEKAFEWYKKAADEGLSVGQYRLGFCYHYGIGTDSNLAMAVECYSLSVAQGNFDAMCELSELLLNGEGVNKDEVRGVELMKNAAENGHAKAQWMWGALLINPSASDITCIEQDISTGVEWMQKSADQGFGMAECTMAAFYVQGIGVEKNFTKAKELYTRALEHGGLFKEMEDDAKEMLAKLQGSSDDSNTGINDYSGIDESVEQEKNDETDAAVSTSSTVMGGGCLYEGVGFVSNASDLDKEACRKVYTEALEGRSGAEYEMGNILANGMYCILVNKKEAFNWYLKSAEHGFADAQYEVARFYSFGEKDVVDCNDEEQFKWYWEAAVQGHGESMYRVADCFYFGSGVDCNKDEARKWYARAVRAGVEGARSMLKNSEDELQSLYEIVDAIPPGLDSNADDEDQEKFRELFKNAKDGDAAAQFQLGHAFVYGDDGAMMNEHHGVMWLKKAAAQGNAEAENLLGDCYRNGWGVTENAVVARRWYQSAADKGLQEAKEFLEEWGE